MMNSNKISQILKLCKEFAGYEFNGYRFNEDLNIKKSRELIHYNERVTKTINTRQELNPGPG